MPIRTRMTGRSGDEVTTRESSRQIVSGEFLISDGETAPIRASVDGSGNLTGLRRTDDTNPEDVFDIFTSFDYQAQDDRSTLVPPEGQAHAFSIHPGGAFATYEPPAAPGAPGSTTTTWRVDGRHQTTTLPSGGVITSVYSDLDGQTLRRVETPDAVLRLDTGTFRPQDPEGEGRQIITIAREPVGGGNHPIVKIRTGRTGSIVRSEGLNVGATAQSQALNAGWRATTDKLLRRMGLVVSDSHGVEHNLSIHRDALGRTDEYGTCQLARDGVDSVGLVTDASVAGTNLHRDYNDFVELEAETTRRGGIGIVERHYERDGLGRVSNATDARVASAGGPVLWTADFDYDALGRLHHATEQGVVRTFTYDTNSNRTQAMNPAGEVLDAAFDAQDRILHQGNEVFEYDDLGRIAGRTGGPLGERHYVYDTFGNLLSVTDGVDTLVEYRVDALGRRVGRRVEGGTWQTFLYLDDVRPLAELDANGNIVRLFVYATGRNVPDYVDEFDRELFLVTDERGSVLAVVDAISGEVVQWRRYDAWGEIVDHDDFQAGFEQPWRS